MAAIPVSLMGILVDTEFRFSQILSGKLNWTQSAANGNEGEARFEISPGRISRTDDDELILDTGTGQFGFELAGGQLQKGNLDLAIPGTGAIDVDFNIPDLSLGGYSPIGGRVRVDIHDLGSLGPIMPLFDSLEGALDIDVSLAGILADPAFIGKASLSNGEFAINASGSTFSEINLSGQVNDMDRSELSGTFRAGEGTGTITSIIYFEDLLSPVIELTLKGESLTIVDVPELNVIANPDFALKWAGSSLEINGRLFIPKARLAPTDIPRASDGQSDDVVIVAGKLPESENDLKQAKPLRIRGTLEVELGKQAKIELKMAKVNVYGATRFTWQDELLPMANGNFDIRGEIQAYGQFLKITRGRINFPDIPADNPYLNIRAERDIFGNSQIQQAGLMVAGTLKRPLIEPYTVPMTNKDRARTLLVTGSDFNYEQGVGAIAVGFYVLPRLYISYGIGVFEDGNTISVRYDLGKRFGVRVTSGQKDTGADLNYTIER
jgi:translocation and assembly module TamB